MLARVYLTIDCTIKIRVTYHLILHRFVLVLHSSLAILFDALNVALSLSLLFLFELTLEIFHRLALLAVSCLFFPRLALGFGFNQR
jgi:hypothetical protein